MTRTGRFAGRCPSLLLGLVLVAVAVVGIGVLRPEAAHGCDSRPCDGEHSVLARGVSSDQPAGGAASCLHRADCGGHPSPTTVWVLTGLGALGLVVFLLAPPLGRRRATDGAAMASRLAALGIFRPPRTA